jgi:hypothetical protein
LQSLKILDRAKATRRTQFASDVVLAALVVRWGAELAGRGGFKLNALDESVKGEIEIKPRLLAVGDDVETSIQLVAHCDRYGIVDQFRAIRFAKLSKVLNGELKPPGKWVAANDRGAQWVIFHLNQK